MRTERTVTSMDQKDLTLSEHSYWALKTGFVLAPLIAGLDKFFDYLTFWPKYVAPIVYETLNVTPQTFMYGAGVIEVIAGIGVLLKPKIFSYVVSAWLVGIILNLLILGEYYDIALRDLGLAIGAYALGQLSSIHEHQVSNGTARTLLHREVV